ncbi:M3 family oligoendopeptidase [Campylobacter corcagiensis]|uniref:M3 family oligoendopeptidase n=1 Tax=Campylobacter corcagiensis TaxID=1448857 RepID=A0A7M1LE31_9BACT|nr:M3 family oligoendopeptidase [Campylobacter corcagiensis]QKF65004.1 oligoendopeptidase F [Campylobacter corcagiensis]QOQ86842.1 M3 family oligoendopeptidase [Campylobacter corcagiensis]
MEWNLKEFFKDAKEFDSFVDRVKKDGVDFKRKFAGNLANLSVEEFLKALDEYEKISQDCAKIATFAYLNFAKDTSKGANLAKSRQICNEIGENLLFFNIEFNKLDDEISNKFIDGSDKYSYYLNLVKKSAKHQLSLKEEEILLKTSPVGVSAFARLFDETMANLRFEFRGESLKEEEILSKLSHPDRSVRKDAAISLSKTLNENLHLLTYILNMVRTDLDIETKLRGYEHKESYMHENNQISKASVDALIGACEANFDISHRYYSKKREILGFEKLYDYDRYAPFSSDEGEISYEESKEIVLKSFSEFSPKFGELAKKAFDENWIDVYPSQNKTGGAFSHSAISSVHPFVLLNFTKTRRDLFTLAHELGHAIHQHLAYKVGYLNSDTPLTTAETASVFCEMLVFQSVVEKIKDPKEKQALLGSKIEDIFATLFRQINFTTFEREIHSKDGELSTDDINEIWMKHSVKMFKDSLELNDYYKIWWSYIPHFIHTPFYCYAYSYAQLLVLSLFALYKSGKLANFSEIYTEFLSLGGSKNPKDMVLKFGLDIESKEFWQIGLNEVKKLVDEFERL